MLIGLSARAAVDVNVLHDRNPLFVTLSDGSIRNGYTVKILNKSREPQVYELSIAGLEGATLSVVGEEQAGSQAELAARPDAVTTYRVHVSAPRARARRRGRGPHDDPDRPRERRDRPSRDRLPGAGVMAPALAMATDRSRWIP